MAILWEHTGEGATDEADIVQGQTGFGSPWGPLNKVGGLTIKYDSAHEAHAGKRSVRFTRTAAADNGYAQVLLGSAITRAQFRWWMYLTELPTNQYNPFVARNSTGFMGYFGLTSAGRVQMYNSTNTGIAASLAAAAFPLNTLVRCEFAIKAGTTTTDGQMEYAYYLGDSNTPVSKWASDGTTAVGGAWAGNVNTGTTGFIQGRFGTNGTNLAPANTWIMEPAVGDGAAGFIGPPSAVAPVAVVTSSLKYLVDATGSTISSGTIASYSITQTSGPATTPEEIDSGRWLITPHASTNLVYNILVTGSGGGTDSEPITLTALVPASGATVRKYKKNEAGLWV